MLTFLETSPPIQLEGNFHIKMNTAPNFHLELASSKLLHKLGTANGVNVPNCSLSTFML